MRKKTVFRPCPNHDSLFAPMSRYRRAEFFTEGGPGFGGGCTPGHLCRVRPGTDIFNDGISDEEADSWVRNWAVNKASSSKESA